MSDSLVAEALRSQARLVLVEAPAGCGKTYQGAEYAMDLQSALQYDRLLILTHTNAACDVFAARTKGFGSRVVIRTIDSLIVSIATAYHNAIGLPLDVAAWARNQQSGFSTIAEKVARLLQHLPSISSAIVSRYPYIICDEHQDASEHQHQLILCLHQAGARMRIFGDPMQSLYTRGKKEREAQRIRWKRLGETAEHRVELKTPHRWRTSASALGDWILQAREALKTGGKLNLRGALPEGLTIIKADNAATHHGQYRLADRRQIDRFVADATEVLVLATDNATVQELRAFFNRRLPIWEGHTRDATSNLVRVCHQSAGDASLVGDAFIRFVQDVAIGFSNTSYGVVLRRELADRCVTKRSRKPAKLQAIARYIVDSPDHRGVARGLTALCELIRDDADFKDIKIDLGRELREAIQLVDYDDANTGIAEISRRRKYIRSPIPPKAISTIHKAKGLECSSVLLMPCDSKHFADTEEKRRRLYVALSRATTSLAVVVSSNSPSPLLDL